MTSKQHTYANFGEYIYWFYANLQMLHYAEKAGSGFDKIFTDLLKKGKSLVKPEETRMNMALHIIATLAVQT